MQNFNLWEMDCWDGYKKAGMKKGKGGKMVNNCVPEEDETNEVKDDIKKGDTVRIKKQHTNSAAEAKRDYIVKELRGPRVLIAPKVWKGGGVIPTESLKMSMIQKVGMSEARVAPSADTQARLTKNMDRSSAADLKRALNNNVDGLDALAWKLQYQFAGVDPKAITELKAVYKQALKMQKSVAKAIDGAK
jgi:hypothetical protein|tara:strand:- start:364 stop:933 length:570 start_codon:yes stop_codon:yes gene_type:complete